MPLQKQPPVLLQSELEPWEHPQWIPPRPHNLPPPSQRPGQRAFTGVVPLPGELPGPIGPIGPPQPTIDRSRFATLSGELVVAGIGIAVATLAVPSPTALRSFLGLRNSSTGGQNLFVAFGAQATQNSWLRIAPNVQILFDTVVPQDEVWVISDVAGGQLTAVFSNYTPDA